MNPHRFLGDMELRERKLPSRSSVSSLAPRTYNKDHHPTQTPLLVTASSRSLLRAPPLVRPQFDLSCNYNKNINDNGSDDCDVYDNVYNNNNVMGYGFTISEILTNFFRICIYVHKPQT